MDFPSSSGTAGHHFSRIGEGKVEAKHCTVRGYLGHPELPSVSLDNRAADGKPHPHAGALVCLEGIEECVDHLFIDSRSVVADGHLDEVPG